VVAAAAVVAAALRAAVPIKKTPRERLAFPRSQLFVRQKKRYFGVV
jgi:hypothetical protein